MLRVKSDCPLQLLAAIQDTTGLLLIVRSGRAFWIRTIGQNPLFGIFLHSRHWAGTRNRKRSLNRERPPFPPDGRECSKTAGEFHDWGEKNKHKQPRMDFPSIGNGRRQPLQSIRTQVPQRRQPGQQSWPNRASRPAHPCPILRIRMRSVSLHRAVPGSPAVT